MKMLENLTNASETQQLDTAFQTYSKPSFMQTYWARGDLDAQSFLINIGLLYANTETGMIAVNISIFL